MGILSKAAPSLSPHLNAMTNRALFTVASAAAGFVLGTSLSEALNGLVLGRYAQVSALPFDLVGDTASFGWLGCAIFAAAAMTAIVAPRVFHVERAPRARVLAFALSVCASLLMAVVTLGCATASSSLPGLDASEALAHAGHWLFVGWLFAQLVIAGGMLVLKSHLDPDLPESSWTMQGYAALGQRAG